MNFRYGDLSFATASGGVLDVPLSEFTLRAWQARFPWGDARASALVTSSPDLDRVWNFVQNAVKTLTLDMYSDSNARQRSADCQADDTVAAQAHYATSAELGLPRMATNQIMKIGHDVDDSGSGSGAFPWPYPRPKDTPAAHANGTGGYVSPTWADWTVLPLINVVNDALFTGDLSGAVRYYDYLLKYHVYAGWLNATGTVAAGLVVDNRAQCAKSAGSCLSALIDTSGGSDDGFVQSHVNAVTQAWVYYGMTQLSRLATWMGKLDDARMLTEKAAAMKAAFNALFIDHKTGAVCDGMCAEVAHTSVHSSFYALAFGLVDSAGGNADGVWNYIKRRVDDSAVGVPCGAYPVQFLLLALYSLESNHGAEAFKVLTSAKSHSWIAMMDVHNATTTMECWEPEELPNLTFSHIWSASPSFIIPWFLVGVRPLLPGWQHVSIKPQAGSTLTWLNYTQPTVKGPIHTTLAQTFDEGGSGGGGGGGGDGGGSDRLVMSRLRSYTLDVEIPGNMVARLHVPVRLPSAATAAAPSDCIRHNGIQKVGKETAEGAHVWIEVESGRHTVELCA